MEEIEEDSKSSPTLSTNKLPPANSCVTEETTEKSDHWRIRQSELQELSKHRPNEIESGSSHKKIAIEHEESDVQDIQRTTSLAFSSSGYISAESLERQPQASAAEGQVGDCVRTVAPTNYQQTTSRELLRDRINDRKARSRVGSESHEAQDCLYRPLIN